MRRFKNILLAACQDFGDQDALNRAIALAKGNGATLTIVDVLEGAPFDVRTLPGFVTPANFQAFVTDNRTDRLMQLADIAREQGVQVTSKLLFGTPFIEITRQVIREQHDLLVMTAEHLGLGEQMFGSTSLHLMRKCPCPVWMEKPGGNTAGHRILAAVDPDPSDRSTHSLNETIMELGISLTRLENSELHIVHSWSLWKEQILRRHSFVPHDQISWWDRETLSMHQEGLKNLLARHEMDDLKYQVHLLKGEPSELIFEQAIKHRIDLIVMGTTCRTGLAGFFIGNTAENVLQNVQCSVLMLKPVGFVSPVKEADAS